jgi:hypothetical protein
MNTKEINENARMSEEILGKWLRFRQFVLLGFSKQSIEPTDEADFLSTTSMLAQEVRKLGQRLDEKQFPFRSKEISALLKSSISIQHFRAMNDADRRAFTKDWHVSKVYLARTVGAMKFLQEGYRPPEPKTAGKKGGGKAAAKKKKIIIGVVVAIIAVVVVAVAMGLV